MIRLSEIKLKVQKASKNLNLVAAVPGALLVGLGSMMLVAPQYLYEACAVSIILFGTISIVYGLKLQRAFEKLRRSVNDVEARVYIQGFRANEVQDKVSDQKKTTYH